MLAYLHRFILPAAFDVLPAAMHSANASAHLLAIALQESKVAHRRQVRGPARGFWQFERGGLMAVRSHSLTSVALARALVALSYPANLDTVRAIAAVEHNDVLACVYARLLLWAHPANLPGPSFSDLAWRIYLESWRPGKPHPETWSSNYAQAWALVQPKER